MKLKFSLVDWTIKTDNLFFCYESGHIESINILITTILNIQQLPASTYGDRSGKKSATSIISLTFKLELLNFSGKIWFRKVKVRFWIPNVWWFVVILIQRQIGHNSRNQYPLTDLAAPLRTNKTLTGQELGTTEDRFWHLCPINSGSTGVLK